MVEQLSSLRCPCGSGLPYPECCGRIHSGKTAPTAESLMRSRYSAFALGNAPYLMDSWHSSTRPAVLELDNDIRWIRLDILAVVGGGPFDSTGIVEFEAFYRGGSQRERSRFVREEGRWFYRGAASLKNER